MWNVLLSVISSAEGQPVTAGLALLITGVRAESGDPLPRNETVSLHVRGGHGPITAVKKLCARQWAVFSLRTEAAIWGIFYQTRWKEKCKYSHSSLWSWADLYPRVFAVRRCLLCVLLTDGAILCLEGYRVGKRARGEIKFLGNGELMGQRKMIGILISEITSENYFTRELGSQVNEFIY